jgi:hypothetical protein
VKLFQIEEPEGGPTDPNAPGAAIGIDASGAAIEVAVSVGGNAAVLADREGFEQSLPVPLAAAGGAGVPWPELFEGARLRAERALGRPVTHAVIVIGKSHGTAAAARIMAAAEQAGLVVLRLAAAAELPSGTATAAAAAVLAEDLAPRAEPGAGSGTDFT